jgi:hypothetical protein
VLGRVLIYGGIALIIAGLVVTYFPKVFGLGRLPGDVVIRGEKFTFYFPIVTCLVLSLLATLLFRFFRK